MHVHSHLKTHEFWHTFKWVIPCLNDNGSHSSVNIIWWSLLNIPLFHRNGSELADLWNSFVFTPPREKHSNLNLMTISLLFLVTFHKYLENSPWNKRVCYSQDDKKIVKLGRRRKKQQSLKPLQMLINKTKQVPKKMSLIFMLWKYIFWFYFHDTKI